LRELLVGIIPESLFLQHCLSGYQGELADSREPLVDARRCHLRFTQLYGIALHDGLVEQRATDAVVQRKKSVSEFVGALAVFARQSIEHHSDRLYLRRRELAEG